MKNILHTFFVLIFAFYTNAQEKKCVFDENSITDDFLKGNPEIQSYIWSNDTKTAKVLMKTGEYVFIKKWACLHYGMEAKKVFILPKRIKGDILFWKEEMLVFGKQFLNKEYYENYKSTIYKSDWVRLKERYIINSKYEIDIPYSNYPEFYVQFEKNKDVAIITISYYMN